ncbi:hypothetical protein [Chryseobacterium sp. G0240]|nr:hypothetical protein [Chryseobacterium sp. G0240]
MLVSLIRTEFTIKPSSIDIAAKIAEVLDVSLDYVVGNTDTVIEKGQLKN